MILLRARHSERGATLVVGLIMLALITVMVTTAFTLSSSTIKSVGNMQFRNEAIAAANRALELVASSNFTAAGTAQSINVDIDNNGTTDYVVMISTPVCVRATVAGDESRSSAGLPLTMQVAHTWNTVWDVSANVTDPVSGASARVRTGIRVLRSQDQKDEECPG
jgi:Tfp pilus assembly protein PilX